MAISKLPRATMSQLVTRAGAAPDLEAVLEPFAVVGDDQAEAAIRDAAAPYRPGASRPKPCRKMLVTSSVTRAPARRRASWVRSPSRFPWHDQAGRRSVPN